MRPDRPATPAAAGWPRRRGTAVSLGWLLAVLSTLPLAAQPQVPDSNAYDPRLSAALESLAHGEDAHVRGLLTELRTEGSLSLHERVLMAQLYGQLDQPAEVLALLNVPLAGDATLPALGYVLLANACLDQNRGADLLRVTEAGLQAHPRAGRLYRLRGIAAQRAGRPAEALRWWESGIRSDPDEPLNYYHAAKAHLRSEEPLWGLMLGELYLLLHDPAHGPDKRQEIAFTCARVWDQQLRFHSDSTFRLRLTQDRRLRFNAGGQPQTSFPMTAQANLAAAISQELLPRADPGAPLSLGEWTRVRQRFIQSWYEQSLDTLYGNLWLRYQHQMADPLIRAGFLHWCYAGLPAEARMPVDEPRPEAIAAFRAWRRQHPLPAAEARPLTSQLYAPPPR